MCFQVCQLRHRAAFRCFFLHYLRHSPPSPDVFVHPARPLSKKGICSVSITERSLTNTSGVPDHCENRDAHFLLVYQPKTNNQGTGHTVRPLVVMILKIYCWSSYKEKTNPSKAGTTVRYPCLFIYSKVLKTAASVLNFPVSNISVFVRLWVSHHRY